MTGTCEACGRETDSVRETAFGEICVTCLDYREEASE